MDAGDRAPKRDYTDPEIAGAARDAAREEDPGEERDEADEPGDTGLQVDDVKKGNILVDPSPGD